MSERFGRYDEVNCWYERRLKKDGTPGKILDMRCAWYTPLFTCEDCGHVGVPMKVRDRFDDIGREWMVDIKRYTFVLCMPCWSRWRKRIVELDELHELIEKLEKAAA